MKAVLVMEMPDGCVDCALCRMENRKGYNDYICVPKNQLVPMTIGTDKPDWCPLREMPNYDYRDLTNQSEMDYQIGFNDCLRAIERERRR